MLRRSESVTVPLKHRKALGEPFEQPVGATCIRQTHFVTADFYVGATVDSTAEQPSNQLPTETNAQLWSVGCESIEQVLRFVLEKRLVASVKRTDWRTAYDERIELGCLRQNTTAVCQHYCKVMFGIDEVQEVTTESLQRTVL